jgi:signal transduction histidine kinase
LKKITLRSDLDASLPPIAIDARLMGRVLANLVSNAVSYSPNGSVVVVATRGGERSVTVTVNDSGPGIADEVLPRLFQRYSTAEQSRSDSTGLGLFIVRTIVDAHGGSVAVGRSPQGGASFTVTLPR